MSINQLDLVKILSPPLSQEIVENIISEYLAIKKSLVLGHYSPSELNGGRFAECIVRLIQDLDNPPYTKFGQQLSNIDQIIRKAENNTSLHDSVRFYIPRLARIILDVRNRRNVAHVGGDVNPNYSDSLFVSQVSDWIFIELLRVYYSCSIDDARKIVESINQTHVPIIFNTNGYLKIQDSSLSTRNKALVLLYYNKPNYVLVTNLLKWTKYQNSSQFRTKILNPLDKDAYIHIDKDKCILTPKGVVYVEQNLNLTIVPS